PLKLHRRLAEFKNEISAIESAIAESGQSGGIYVREIRWRPYLQNEYKNKSDRRAEQIAELLTPEYVNKQIRLMNNSIKDNPHLALGISKELIETCCKYVLRGAGTEIDKDWDVARLVKEANKKVNLVPFEVDNVE